MPPFKKEWAVLNLDKIASKFEGEEVTREALIEKAFLKGKEKSCPIKVLAGQGLTKSLSFKSIEKFSKSAQEAIEKAGGSISQFLGLKDKTTWQYLSLA